MCFNYDGTCDVYNETVRKSRKDRKCDVCGKSIARGEDYLAIDSLYDGSWSSEALCNLCQQNRVAIFRSEREHGCGWQESWPPLDEIENYMRDSGLERAERTVNLRQFEACRHAVERYQIWGE